MWTRRHRVLLATAVGLWLSVCAGVAFGERVALVIGNARYAHAPRLANPLNDAADIGAALSRLGFAVTKLENAGYAALRQGLLAFTRAASAAEVAVVFYAGHGIEVDQRNFLVPVDARLASDQDVEFEAVPLELVMHAVARASRFRLVILDACRENPFAASMQRAGGTRSIGRGLARVEPAAQTLVAYAAKGGTVASDGSGRNSPYSTALLRHLEEPGLEIVQMFRRVRDAVLAATGGRQEPFVYGSLSSQGVYLTARAEPDPEPDSAPVVGQQAPAPVTERRPVTCDGEFDLEYWRSVKDSTNPEAYEAYLSSCPEGQFVLLARSRLKELQSSDMPPPAPEATFEAAEASLDLGIAERRLIQLGLTAEGFDPGPADGLIGNRTRAALKQWQASRGAASTGYLDVESAKALLASGRQREAQEREAARHRQEQEAERRRREQEAREQARREAEERQKWEKLGLEMVRVEGGSFTMGCQSGRDRECFYDEMPAHQVQVRSFEIGKYEVTQPLWEAVMGENPSSFGDCPECPVESVSWDDIQRFLSALNTRTGKQYRLPTEAEWEYAARGGRQSRGYRYAGGNEAGSVGWSEDNSGGRTHPVGRKRANELGLHDMSGNVYEWVQDCWNDSYRGAPADGRAWERGECGRRVARGGSWINYPKLLRSAYRLSLTTGNRSSSLSFRIARTLTP